MAQNDFQQARIFVEASLALFGEISSRSNGGGATPDLGWTTLSLGDEAQARTLFTKSLNLFREVDDRRGAGEAIERLERLRHVKMPCECQKYRPEMQAGTSTIVLVPA